MAFQLTVPNFNAALPTPRAYVPPSPSFGSIAGAALIDTFSDMAAEYKEAQDTKQLVGQLADNLQGINPEAAATYRAMQQSIKPNFFAAKGKGGSANVKTGLLQDALDIIKSQSEYNNRLNLLERGAAIDTTRDATKFGFGAIEDERRLGNQKDFFDYQMEGYSERDREQFGMYMAKTATEEGFRIARTQEANKMVQEISSAESYEDYENNVRDAIINGVIRDNDASDILEMLSKKKSKSEIDERLKSVTFYEKRGTERQPSASGSEPSDAIIPGPSISADDYIKALTQ
jgi:hypothetical protein